MPTGAQASAAAEELAERLSRRAVLGSRYDAGLARDVIRLLTSLESDLAGQIAQMDITGVARASAQRQRLQKLLDQAREVIRDTYRRVRVMTERSYDELWEIEADATRAAMNGSFRSAGIRLDAALPTDSYMAALAEENLVLGQPATDFWARQEQSLRGAFRGQMEIGLQSGETVDQLIRRLRGGMRNGARVPGIMDTSRANAAALVRTSAASVGNEARLAVFDNNLDVIDEYVHLSKLDTRTSPTCVGRAGKRWTARDRQPIGHSFPFQTPPLHFNCRSVIVVRVVGGALPTEQNGQQWFDSLSPTDQNTVFGRGRADLYRSGDISLRQLFDQSGRPIPLADMRSDERNAGDRTVRRP